MAEEQLDQRHASPMSSCLEWALPLLTAHHPLIHTRRPGKPFEIVVSVERRGHFEDASRDC